MEQKQLKIAVITLFAVAMCFYIVAIIKFPDQPTLNVFKIIKDWGLHDAAHIIGNACMGAAIIGATQIKKP